MAELDELVREMATLQQRLDDLPRDAFLERVEIKDRLTQLRAEAAGLRSGASSDVTTRRLQDRLASLRRQRDEVERSQIDVVKQAGTLTAGIAGTTHQGDATRLNRQIRAGRGLPEIEAQIASIKRQLRNRGVDPD